MTTHIKTFDNIVKELGEDYAASWKRRQDRYIQFELFRRIGEVIGFIQNDLTKTDPTRHCQVDRPFNKLMNYTYDFLRKELILNVELGLFSNVKTAVKKLTFDPMINSVEAHKLNDNVYDLVIKLEEIQTYSVNIKQD